MMVFFLIVLTFITLVNVYIYTHVRILFPDPTGGRRIVAAVFWIVAFSYIAGRFLERGGISWMAVPLIRAGSWWLGAMVYLTLLFLVADIVRWITLIPGMKEFSGLTWSFQGRKLLSLAICAVTAVILVAGHINALHPAVKRISVPVEKTSSGKSFRMVVASDIHLGITISGKRLEKLVNLINRQDADVVLLAGDIFDEDLEPVIRNNLGDHLRNLRATEGVFAILGNHEFYGNAADAQKYLEEHRITVLRDSVVLLRNELILAGREDITSVQMSGNERKTAKELLNSTDWSKTVIVMDHQPFHLAELAKLPVDLQVSGHTHHGQLWPFQMITNAMYEISKGYGKIGNTHFYVSPGVGTWGPPVRTSSRPEIAVIEVTGNGSL
jgi:predicted MPP superfamily phosphohydrolase